MCVTKAWKFQGCGVDFAIGDEEFAPVQTFRAGLDRSIGRKYDGYPKAFGRCGRGVWYHKASREELGV
jgi:hypothetical protein